MLLLFTKCLRWPDDMPSRPDLARGSRFKSTEKQRMQVSRGETSNKMLFVKQTLHFLITNSNFQVVQILQWKAIFIAVC